MGSILGGYLVDRISNPYYALTASFALTTVLTFFIPYCSKYYALAILMCAQTLSLGILDTHGNVLVIRYWGKDCGPYMQSLHFCFGLGAFVAPLIALPFIAASTAVPVSELHVKWAYWICGFIGIPVTVIFFLWIFVPIYCLLISGGFCLFRC